MTHCVYFAYPGDLEAKTGGYGYDRRIISELRKLGWDVSLIPLGGGFPFPDPETLSEAEKTLGALAQNSLVLVDGLAYGTFGEIASRLAHRLTLVALVHHPLASEGNVSAQETTALVNSEQLALAYANAIFVTSSSTRQQLIENYDVPEDKIVVAIPGTERGIRSPRQSKIPHILSIGSIIPRKGHDVLVSALAKIADMPWNCSIVGNRTMDVDYDTALQRQIIENQLTDRIVLTGQINDTRSEFARSDIFALASRYEGYGMVFAEALSHGLPIIACSAGAVPEVVPEDAGILVPPDDPDAFASALRRTIQDSNFADRMADASFRHGQSLPQWVDTAKLFSAALQKTANNERI
ncbi:glycosyltransferase family 4 protein [Phyllobacterium sp. SB3]|uniref:glycosyltransferase family 4 protein n=1 Tax=Phyllobacterium sp. SB3 TaxID=3156073 RepID=UPI0032AF1BF9